MPFLCVYFTSLACPFLFFFFLSVRINPIVYDNNASGVYSYVRIDRCGRSRSTSKPASQPTSLSSLNYYNVSDCQYVCGLFFFFVFSNVRIHFVRNSSCGIVSLVDLLSTVVVVVVCTIPYSV